jgi:hypothetical protein
MTTIKVVSMPRDSQEFRDGFPYGVEVRREDGALVNRWTFRTSEHAFRERKHVASWFELPTSVLPDSGVVAT